MMPDYSKQQWDEMNKVLLWPGTEEEFEEHLRKLKERSGQQSAVSGQQERS